MLVEFTSRYLPLHREGAVLSPERMGDATVFKLDLLGGQGSPARQSMEMGVGAMHRLIRQLPASSLGVESISGPSSSLCYLLRLKTLKFRAN
jgi:hypothetical protein